MWLRPRLKKGRPSGVMSHQRPRRSASVKNVFARAAIAGAAAVRRERRPVAPTWVRNLRRFMGGNSWSAGAGDRRTTFSTWNEIAQVGVALDEGGFAGVEGGFVGSVFDFDADWAGVADVGEDGEKAAPVHVAEAGEFGSVVFVGMGEDADVVEPLAVDADVFGVDVEEAVLEFAHRSQIVHALPDHVRG